MPYSQFNLETIKTKFGIALVEEMGTFANLPDVEYSNLLEEILKYTAYCK